MITTLAGENEVERQAELRRVVAVFEKEYSDMGVERLDGEEASYERMVAAGQSLPFLVPRKLVVLRAPGANKEFVEKFEEFMLSVSDTNDVIIIEPKLDKRLSYYKTTKKQTDFKEFAVLDASGLARFATDYVKELGGSISSNDARLLVERVGTNQLGLQQELDKLLANELIITRESIENLTEQTPQSNVFELLDAAFAGDTKRTMRLYDEQRALKVEPQQVIAMLAWQLHVLAVVKTAKERSADDIAREAKLNPFVVRKTQSLARHISLTRLKQLITSSVSLMYARRPRASSPTKPSATICSNLHQFIHKNRRPWAAILTYLYFRGTTFRWSSFFTTGFLAGAAF
ncbi:DNA polymerase III subunit delta [Candidatus Saccharibacteria bacterium]|nr:MAG: DNA polymerase III subunit delta [Candidatus Saccharibacteria bacterium]